MSVAMLSRRAKTVEVVDDMESFFYVILYYAARYLASNITNVPIFIENFFDSYGWDGSAYTVGETKSTAIKEARGVVVDTDKRKLVCFSSPLDQVLRELRDGFHSLYMVREYDSPENLLPIPVPPAEDNPPRTPPKSKVRKLHGPLQGRAIKGAKKRTDIPTDDDRERAAEVADHEWALSLLQKRIVVRWPKIKNMGDLVPSTWKSRRDLGPSVTPSNRCTSKRRKLPPNSGVDEADEEPVVVEDEPEDQPADQLEDQHADQPEEQPVDQLVDQPDEQLVGQLVEQPEEQPVEKPVEKPAGKRSRVRVPNARLAGVRRSARLANKV